MIRPVGRLFWKLLSVDRDRADILSLDQAVHTWVTHHYQPHSDYEESSDSGQTRRPPFNPPIMVDILASLGCAALLAWLLSKPIRNLHSALSDAAGGNLDIRVADRMGFGDDELKDQGTEFDRMMSRLQALITAQRSLPARRFS